MKLFSLVMLVFMLLMISSFVYGQPEDGGNPPPMKRMGRMLDLTDEQRSQVEDLRLSFEKEKLPLQSKIHELQNDLKLELTRDSFDEKKANQLLGQIESVRTELHKKRINHMRSVRNILNEDQKKKFDMHILSNQGFGHDQRMHHGMPHHQMNPGPGSKE
jgi:Spy/CpxP family protein refolding chaperone